MKLPQRPPKFSEALQRSAGSDPGGLLELLERVGGPLVGDRYRHWHKLRFLEAPEGLTHEQWWVALKFARISLRRPMPLVGTDGKPFFLGLVDPALRLLHEIDSMAGKVITGPAGVVDEPSRERHLLTSLMEEAITSSQLEGAATTRKSAVEMLRSGRAPRTHAERMIYNNYATITWLRSRAKDPLSPELVRELHGRMTSGTLEEAADEGRFRTSDDVRVRYLDEVVHQPPPAVDLGTRMSALCRFANEETPSGFLHPVVRAILLHFWLAYEHPFVDGNGRTARALFYWSMLRSGHWIAEFLPISRIFLQSPSRYARAFIYAEGDDNDLTYFVLFHLDVLHRALADLHDYLKGKAAEQQAVVRLLSGTPGLNHRQIALLTHARKNPTAEYTIAGHATSHGVVYQTARTDLLGLERRNLLVQARVGRRFSYRVAVDLERLLSEAAQAPRARRRSKT